MIHLEGTRASGVLGFLRPEAQRAIKLVARNWQKLACTYRLQDSVRRAPMMTDVLDAPDSCATLEFLGLSFDYPALGVSEVSAAPGRELTGGGS